MKSFIFVFLCGFLYASAQNQLPLVLVHGAAVSGATWDPVIPLLTAPSIANPSQRGRTQNFPGTNPADITFDQYISDLTAVATTADQGHGVILVGHSFGGLLISQVGENLGPNKIRALIYVAAYIPATGTVAGNSFDSHLSNDKDSIIGQWATFAPDKSWVTINNASAVFLNDCEAGAAKDAATLDIQSIREPTRPFLTNVTYSTASFGAIPKYYISTSLDTAVTPNFQKLQYDNLAIRQTVIIEAGHSPMTCKPALLAAEVNKFTAIISQDVFSPTSAPTSAPTPAPTATNAPSSSSSLVASAGFALMVTVALLM